MGLSIRSAALLAAMLSLTAVGPAGAQVTASGAGQAYPSKPVRVVIPWPPGGGNDISGRIVMQKLSESLGQQFTIDNRGGAGGTIGTEVVAKAPSDGYTIMVQSVTHVAQSLSAQGLDPWSSSPEEMTARLKTDSDKYERLITLTGARID